MPSADSEIRRAYRQGYALGAEEAHATKGEAPTRFAEEGMQRSFVRGWTAGRKNKGLAEKIRLRRAEWYQANKERINDKQRRRRRIQRTTEAVTILPRLTTRISKHAATAA